MAVRCVMIVLYIRLLFLCFSSDLSPYMLQLFLTNFSMLLLVGSICLVNIFFFYMDESVVLGSTPLVASLCHSGPSYSVIRIL